MGKRHPRDGGRTVMVLLVFWALAGWGEPSRGAAPLEPWVDRRLPVTEGLQLWLDSTTLQEALHAEGGPPLQDQTALERWPDGSGNKRHFTQPDPPKRPQVRRVGQSWMVRFDGRQTHLRHNQIPLSGSSCTLVLVVAPHGSAGTFPAIIAANERGRNDYQTGFTIDLGPWPSLQFDQLNVEGKGFQGVRDLLNASFPLGSLRTLQVVLSAERREVRLWAEDQLMEARPCRPSTLQLDEWTLGARYYNLGPNPPRVQGFWDGYIAEVLLYDRELSSPELEKLRQYLDNKYRSLKPAVEAAFRAEHPYRDLIQPVRNPPAVQVLIPGFAVYELPVDLTNINNVRYRSDGTLVALAYNGNIYLLSDRDGDGLEETVRLFWDNQGRLRGPIGMALTPDGYPRGQELFVASKGKVSLIVDRDGDDSADEEIIVAQGWKELPLNVDALGVALDRDGNVYFGLGTADFANPYLIDKEGRAHYRLDNERGTIQKLSADFSQRETICTGLRFTVGLAFNRHGDLFCTDQEGATWLPNGNPFDELLHILPGRHYGFPPRHPRYLPNVVDEPSLFDYEPQHQSTCGLVFNESVAGGPVFGPSWWEGDAIVCGEARGKIYRTKLARTPVGYVAVNETLARLTMLTVDACVSPAGALVVACHSGPPDWGTGPAGKGKLYKIVPERGEVARPVLVFAASPQEVQVVFDQPLDPKHLRGLASQTRIVYGRYVSAGDRFETLRPPYAVVAMQLDSPRFVLPVLSAQLSADRHTLILTTPPQVRAVPHAVELPQLQEVSPPPRALRQYPGVDLQYGLTGVQLHVEAPSGQRLWSGWLPHVDLSASRSFTAASPVHTTLWSIAQPARWTFQTQLDLTDMLRPAVQPGSVLKDTLPPEVVTVTFQANCPLEVTVGPGEPRSSGAARATVNPGETARIVGQKSADEVWTASVTFVSPWNGYVPVKVQLEAEAAPQLHVWFHTQEDPRARPLQARRILLPWALPPEGSSSELHWLARKRQQLGEASWGRGRRIFFGEKAICYKCHKVHGEGGSIGPDLSNLLHRDIDSVLRDIQQPSFSINPDYVSYAVILTDGRVLTGTVRTEGETLVVGQQDGTEVRVSRSEVEKLVLQEKSSMPEDLHQRLTHEETQDLLAFLLLEPPRLGDPNSKRGPGLRKRAEVEQVLAGAEPVRSPQRPVTIVLVAGPKDHGPGEHDYPAWQQAWSQLLEAADGVRVIKRWEWPADEDYEKADVIVFYKALNYLPEQGVKMDKFLQRGGGLAFIHWAVHGGKDPQGLARRIGLAGAFPGLRYRHGRVRLEFCTASQHPIVRNFRTVELVDETYWNFVGDPGAIQLLATSVEEGQPRPQVWTVQRGGGRVFVSIPGHYRWTFDDPLFRVLLLRGIAWCAGEPVDRFQELVWLGAAVEP
jgi:putative heme-binding domain-containing protein